MQENDIKNWLESIDKQISSSDIDITTLGLDHSNPALFKTLSQLIVTTPKKRVFQKPSKISRSPPKNPEFSSSLLSSNSLSSKSQVVPSTSKKLSTSSVSEAPKPSSIVSQKSLSSLHKNPELKFKPSLNKRSLEIASSLGSSKERLLLSKSPKNSENRTRNSSNSNRSSFSSFSQFSSISHYGISSPLRSTASLQLAVQKLLDWNRVRLEKINEKMADREKEEMSKCTFRPIIHEAPGMEKKKEEKKCERLQKRSNKRKYSGKYVENAEPRKVEKEKIRDLDINEYEHAIKRLHWELESIYLPL